MIQPTPCAIWCLTSFHGHLMRWTTTQPPCKPYPKGRSKARGLCRQRVQHQRVRDPVPLLRIAQHEAPAGRRQQAAGVGRLLQTSTVHLSGR